MNSNPFLTTINRGVSVQDLYALWEVYRLQIEFNDRFDRVSEQEVGPDGYDPKDQPYVLLQNLLDAADILTRDKDIERMGGWGASFGRCAEVSSKRKKALR